MLSLYVHYINKYPGGQVKASGDSIDVYSKDGAHRVALRKNGAGQWQCESETMGCSDRHDLSPIPKDSRIFKLCKTGKVIRSEEADERQSVADELAAHECGGSGKVPSIQELHMHCNPKSSPTSGYDHNSSWASMKPAEIESPSAGGKKSKK